MTAVLVGYTVAARARNASGVSGPWLAAFRSSPRAYGDAVMPSRLDLRTARIRPVHVEGLAARRVHALVGVGAEVIALALEQVGGEHRGAIAVEVCERAHEGGAGDPCLRRHRDHAPPARLAPRELTPEVRVEEQVDE